MGTEKLIHALSRDIEPFLPVVRGANDVWRKNPRSFVIHNGSCRIKREEGLKNLPQLGFPQRKVATKRIQTYLHEYFSKVFESDEPRGTGGSPTVKPTIVTLYVAGGDW